MLIYREIFQDEGPRSHRLRTLEANLLSGSFIDLLTADPSYAGVKSQLTEGDESLKRYSRWCPGCLRHQEEPYGRVGWEIRFADACSVCSSWLVDRCSSCDQLVAWKRASYVQCDCGQYLTSETSPAAPSSLVQLSTALELKALGKAQTFIPLLEPLSISQCMRLIRWIGSYGALPTQRSQQKVLDSDTLAVSWSISTFAAEVLYAWPENFVRLLDSLRIKGDEHTHGSLMKTFGPFYTALYSSLSDPEFDFLRGEFESYVAQHWSGSIGRRNKRLFELSMGKMSWIPVAEAARLAGISSAALIDLGQQNQVEIQSYTTQSGRQYHKVKRSSLDDLIGREFKDFLPLSHVARRLGLKKTRLQAVLNAICPEAEKLKPTNVWMIPSSWLSNIENLMRSLTLVSEGSQWVSLDRLLRHESPSDAAVAMLIQSIIHQKIAVAKSQVEIKFSDLLCDRKMVDALWSKFLDSPTTHRTLMDAANFLNVKQEVIYALVRSGILSVDQKTIGRRTSQWVAEEELARFSNHYVFARDLAKAMSTNPKSLSMNLKVIGVMPVAGPGVDNCRQLLYRKADLVAANVPVTAVP